MKTKKISLISKAKDTDLEKVETMAQVFLLPAFFILSPSAHFKVLARVPRASLGAGLGPSFLVKSGHWCHRLCSSRWSPAGDAGLFCCSTCGNLAARVPGSTDTLRSLPGPGLTPAGRGEQTSPGRATTYLLVGGVRKRCLGEDVEEVSNVGSTWASSVRWHTWQTTSSFSVTRRPPLGVFIFILQKWLKKSSFAKVKIKCLKKNVSIKTDTRLQRNADSIARRKESCRWSDDLPLLLQLCLSHVRRRKSQPLAERRKMQTLHAASFHQLPALTFTRQRVGVAMTTPLLMERMESGRETYITIIFFFFWVVVVGGGTWSSSGTCVEQDHMSPEARWCASKSIPPH